MRFAEDYLHCNLTFWEIGTLSSGNTGRIKSLCEPWKRSNSWSWSVMTSVSGVSVTVRVVRAGLRWNPCGVFVSARCRCLMGSSIPLWSWCSVPLLSWGSIPLRFRLPLLLCWLLIPLIPLLWLRCLISLSVPMVRCWRLIMKNCIIANWEIRTLVGINACRVFSSWLRWCTCHECH